MGTDRTNVNTENPAQHYDRVVYQCHADDTWVTVETPVAEEES